MSATPKVDFRPATQALVEQYFGGAPPFGLRGYVAVLGEEVVGVGGIFWYEGLPIAFSQMKDAMRPLRKECSRAARLLESYLDDLGFEVYAVADMNERTSDKLLARLGFEYTGVDMPEGPLMIRRRT